MKKYLLTLTAVLGLTVTYAQTTTSDLYGTWFLVDYPLSWKNTDTLVFSKQSHNPHNFGESIEINKEGEFYDNYSAPCGNDAKIHHTKGNWSYDNQSKLFETTVPVDFREKKYKILSLKRDTLIFVKP
jgi:hypothetical protein